MFETECLPVKPRIVTAQKQAVSPPRQHGQTSPKCAPCLGRGGGATHPPCRVSPQRWCQWSADRNREINVVSHLLKDRRIRTMPSVYRCTMLRSEAIWFPLFIRICGSRLKYVMNPIKTDCEPMKQVTQCENYRQVRSVLKAYNKPHFDDLVHAQEMLAKKAITRDYGIRFNHTVRLFVLNDPLLFFSFSKNIAFFTAVFKVTFLKKSLCQAEKKFIKKIKVTRVPCRQAAPRAPAGG